MSAILSRPRVQWLGPDLPGAQCRGSNLSFLLDEGKSGPRLPFTILEENKEALRLCKVCPVREPCRDYYVENPPEFPTIAGGMYFGGRSRSGNRGKRRVVYLPLELLDTENYLRKLRRSRRRFL